MSIQSMWPLLFLFGIPLIIVLYLLKQQAVDHVFSSNMLWQEIYKNLEAKTPFDKLRQNILLYLQILVVLLLVFAMMGPVWKHGGSSRQAVFVMDTSASMKYEYKEKENRLQHSIALAKKQLDSLEQGTQITILSCAQESSLVYQGEDAFTAKRRLEDLSATQEEGDLSKASVMLNRTILSDHETDVYCYTDTKCSEDELLRDQDHVSLHVNSVYTTGENCLISYINYSVTKQGVEALCKVENDGKSAQTQDVSLYAGDTLLEVQTITIEPQKSEIVYFKNHKEKTDGSVVLTAELSQKDALTDDNRQSTVVTDSQEKRALLLTEGNVFLEKALSLDDRVTVMKSESAEVLRQKEDVYDLYVLDGVELPDNMTLADLPEQAAVLFLHYPGKIGESVAQKKEKDVVATFSKSAVTQYVQGKTFAVAEAQPYVLPKDGVPFLKGENGETIGYTTKYGGRNLAVLGVDLHQTDFALQTEFPIFMAQLEAYLLGEGTQKTEVENFPTAESKVIAAKDLELAARQKVSHGTSLNLQKALLLLVLFLFLLEWITYIKQVRTNKKKQFLCTRIVLCLVVALAMSGITIPKKQQKSETIFLVDTSDSMTQNKEKIEKFIQKMVKNMPAKNTYAVAAFGKDYAVDRFLSNKKSFGSIEVKPVTTATNIEQAVQSAASLFDEAVEKQLVLFTDGGENEGDVSRTAAALDAKEIRLSAVTMDSCVSAQKEAYIEQVDVPHTIHNGEHYNVTVSVCSNIETEAKLFLYSGRALKQEQEVHLTKGSNQFVFADTAGEGNLASYKAVLEPQEDTIVVNNTYVTYAQIDAKPKMLLVEGKPGEAEEFEKILKNVNVDYDKVTPKGVPDTVKELNQYKAVITLNVYYDDLRQEFAKALASYVKNYAGGYICIGGDSSYALGGYRDTELEEILPVKMELEGKQEIPKLAMAMVIDQSGSMSGPSLADAHVTGLDLAIQAAVAGVDELRAKDDIGVLAFDDTYHWIVPLQSAADKEGIQNKIASIGEGGGTSIYPAFQEAYEKIKTSDATLKHIILLTDGQDSHKQYDDLIAAIDQAKITVSTVAVGEEADQEMLQEIARQCGGRYYYTDVDNGIPRIFAQEVYLSTEKYLHNEIFTPTITSNSELLDGVTEQGMPALYGYIAATPKDTANVLLTSDEGDPILSTWQYGLGKTVAWNTDATNEWTAEFAGWSAYPTLWANLLQSVQADTSLGDEVLQVEKEGNEALLHYETKEYDEKTTVEAVVSDEKGETSTTALEATRPGTFEARIPLTDVGVYSINLRRKNGREIQKSYNTAYANQYSKEYQFQENTNVLEQFVQQVGGKKITLNDNVWKKTQKTSTTRVPLTIPLLVGAVLLWLADIAQRRLNFDFPAWLQRHLPKWNLRPIPKRKRAPKEQNMTMALSEEKKQSKVHTFAKKKDKKTEGALGLDMNQLLQKKRERE